MAYSTFVTRLLVALHVVCHGADILCDTSPNPLALDLVAFNNTSELRANLEAVKVVVEAGNADLKSRLAPTVSRLETETKHDAAITQEYQKYKAEYQFAQDALLEERSDKEVVTQRAAAAAAAAAAKVIAGQLAKELATKSDTIKSTLGSYEELGVLYLALDNKTSGFKKDIAHLQKKLGLPLILFAAASNQTSQLTAGHTDLLSRSVSKENVLVTIGKTLDEEKGMNTRLNGLLEEKEDFLCSLTSINQELEMEVELSRQEMSGLEGYLGADIIS